MSIPVQVAVEVSELTLTAAIGHPNRMEFKGLLVNLDSPSTRAPNGSQGKRIIIPSEVAAARLNTLIGMGLNYSPSLDAHAQRRKVGVIEKSWIEGSNVWVSGCIWKSDFPEATEDLKGRTDLGMSMELGSVVCNDQNAPIWRIDDFIFTGATILTKNSAAYQDTLAIAASAVKKNKKQRIEEILNMSVTTKQKTAAATTIDPTTLAGILAGALTKALEPVTAGFAKQSEQLTALNATLTASAAGDDEDDDESVTVADLLAAATKKAAPVDDDEDDEDDDVDASSEDDEDDVDAAVSTGDMDELADADDDANDEAAKPGQTPKAMNKNHGNKKTVTKGKVKTKKMAVTGSTAKLLKLLMAQNEELRKQNESLAASNKKLKPLTASVEKLQAAASKVEAQTARRSVELPAVVTGLLSRAGLSAKTLVDEGRVLTVPEVDGILANVGAHLDITTKVGIKSELARHGVMEEGRVDRSRRVA